MRSFTPFLIMSVLVSAASAQQCYSMDGQALDSRYQPCYPQASSSACCMLNGTQGAGQQNDICLDSGLCQSTSGWYAGFLYINGCTDKTGKADGCAKLCSFLGNQYSWSVLQCQPGQFCCRAASDTTNCCNNNATIITTSHIGNLLLPGSTAAINTTYNFTGTPAATGNTTSNSTCSALHCPANHTATVSGVLGGVLGAALIGALIALAFALRSRQHYRSDLGNTKSALTATETQAAAEKASFQKELDAQRRHVSSMPPNYPNANSGYVSPGVHGYNPNNGAYSPGYQPQPAHHAFAQEIDNPRSYSELSGGQDNEKGNVVELTSESRS